MASAALAFADHPDLTGRWQLDAAASDFAGTPPATSGQMTITSSPHKILHFNVSTQGAISKVTQESEWRIGDRYHPVIGGEGGELMAKWDNGILVGRRQLKNRVEEIRFRLAPGGESLTESIGTPNGTVLTLIWRRE